MSFASRLDAALAVSRLCVGIDPHPQSLSQWGLQDDTSGLIEYGNLLLGAAHGETQVVKIQVSLFEAFGLDGMKALAEIMQQARNRNFLVIADAKRGDIGSSMTGYYRAWLKVGSDFEADALTVNSYLGIATLRETLAAAASDQKGLFTLVATSNPEATSLQSPGLVQQVLDETISLSAEYDNALGAVIGATVDQNRLGIKSQLADSDIPILAPGFGAQGVGYTQVSEIFANNRLLVASSRDISSVTKDLLSGHIHNIAGELR